MISKNYKVKYKVPFSDLLPIYEEIKNESALALEKIYKKGNFILGEEVRFFEEEFAKFCHAKFAVGVSSGTDALFLSLKALGIGEGDEVIVPAYTYIATAFAVTYSGAKPVFVDIDEDSYCMDKNLLEKTINHRTKAIIPVHLYGQSCQMIELKDIATKHNLKIVEDAAQAHGVFYKPLNKRVGSIGDLGCFSFYPSKNLGAFGDGGIITTNSEGLYKKILMLRDCGRINKYEHIMIGRNNRLDTVQAAVLRIKLPRLDNWNRLRQEAAAYYDELFKGVEGVITPKISDYSTHIYHVYALRIKNRDKILNHLRQNGIGALIHYSIPLHLQKAYEFLGYKKGDFQISEKVASEIISLPMFPHISKDQIELVVKTIKEFH